MIRTPLRPLARILRARSRGENPDLIERENIRKRHEEMQDRARQRAESRLLVLGLFFFCAFTIVGGRMVFWPCPTRWNPWSLPPAARLRPSGRISWTVTAQSSPPISKPIRFMPSPRN